MSPARAEITAIACLRDNYAWLITPGPASGVGTASATGLRPAGTANDLNGDGGPAIVVDPGEPAPILAALTARNLHLAAILATHHHHDHTGGIKALCAHPRGRAATVYGSSYDAEHGRLGVPATGLADGERLTLLGLSFEALHTPGHTAGALCYHLPAEAAVFTGDTLFLAGCGRLLEGSAGEQWASMQRLRALPAATRVYCGHEYTRKNLAFAAALLPHERAVLDAQAEAERAVQRRQPTVPGTIARERATNPFLRADQSLLMAKVGAANALASFTALRAQRDTF